MPVLNTLMKCSKVLDLDTPLEKLPNIQEQVFCQEPIITALRKLTKRLATLKTKLAKHIEAVETIQRGIYGCQQLKQTTTILPLEREFAERQERKLQILLRMKPKEEQLLLEAEIQSLELRIELLQMEEV